MSAKLQFYQSIYLKINFISIKFHNDSYCELERIFKGPITPVRFTVLRSLVNDNSGRARGEDDFFLFFYIIFLDIILISYWVKYARIWVFSDPYCLVQGPNLQFYPYTTPKIKFFIRDFFSKCDHWLYLLKKSSMENFIFLCSVTWQNEGHKRTAVWQILCSVLLYYFTVIWSALRREMTEHKYILTFLTPK